MKRSVSFSYLHHVGTLTVSADGSCHSPSDFAKAAQRRLERLFGPLRFESCGGARRSGYLATFTHRQTRETLRLEF